MRLHSASIPPVRTLYIRNVPDDVAERLEELASREGLSLNALAVRELSQAARRSRNAALLADLPSFDVGIEDLVAIIHEGRRDRDRL